MNVRDLRQWMEKEASPFGLLRFFKLKVSNALVLYALLGMLDLAFSKMACTVGIAEGHPVLQAALDYGLFAVDKIVLTLTVLLAGIFLWKHALIKRVMFMANAGMFLLALVLAYGMTLYLMR